jgi:hypothetical protein
MVPSRPARARRHLPGQSSHSCRSAETASIEEYPNKTNDDADCLVRELTKTLSNYCIRLRIAVSPEYETIAMTPAVLVQRARRKKAD